MQALVLSYKVLLTNVIGCYAQALCVCRFRFSETRHCISLENCCLSTSLSSVDLSPLESILCSILCSVDSVMLEPNCQGVRAEESQSGLP